MSSEVEVSVECAIVNLLFAQSEISDSDSDAGSIARAMAHINDAISELRPFAAQHRRLQVRGISFDPSVEISSTSFPKLRAR